MEKRIAFVKDWGAYLRVNKGKIECVAKNEVKWSLSPAEVSSIIFLVNSSLSTEVIRLANEFGIEMVFFHDSEPIARVITTKYGGSMKVWIKQIREAKKNPEKYAKQFVYGKLHNQWVTIHYYEKKYGFKLGGDELYGIAKEVLTENNIEQIMVKEAEGAKIYWKGVKYLLPKELGFKGRKKRGDNLDPFNKALNIGYGMLRKSVWGAVISAGLNPYIGFLHKFRSGRLSLVFDLMEEFRSPFVDRPLIGLARENYEKLKDLKVIYSTFVFDEDEIYTQARRLVNSILHGDEYRPFMAK
ncbi:putative CRISPR-associated protein Cas1 [Sulfurisphaera tokodaii str. 7]|uniref:CRISPR-associated endonuclease Cas1 n=1 Tax=Sulfurisphaera tokodaii (strain DSM 16993 / JCM 10545 / NBRC 100140 / 7) TaxID=273063 RepID=Q977B7_SULTO|nr:CRISPR-associated endonuclease Cas1 [Sulfurisphaera tokodaii]BAB64977.1 putative CRISPR-associated protein Cas1 [Sulfurisphaera tokodaii str. 7]